MSAGKLTDDEKRFHYSKLDKSDLVELLIYTTNVIDNISDQKYTVNALSKKVVLTN